MNIALAAGVVTLGIFDLQYSLPAGFSSVVAFQIAGRRTIYDYALELSEKGHYGDWKRIRKKRSTNKKMLDKIGMG